MGFPSQSPATRRVFLVLAASVVLLLLTLPGLTGHAAPSVPAPPKGMGASAAAHVSRHASPHHENPAPAGLPFRFSPAAGQFTEGLPSADPYCFGVWPSRGQDAEYQHDCYGHDEPGISAYSTLPGSAGNVSWSLTLPIGSNLTHEPSDLYATFWFGMVLTDPNSALDEAFLELQIYPDHNWFASTPVFGNWIGAARVVQADLATGYLDNAYFSQLEINGTTNNFLNMHDGDALRVNLTGWSNNPLGESVVVSDLTKGVAAVHHLYNATGHYPLNPTYSSNDFPDALQWTDTGAPPVSFAWEIGHAEHPPYPENSSWNGCTPGVPPPTPQNPSVPCPGYDPSSWVNDSPTPLRLSPPVFWNGTTTAAASEIQVLNSVGGAASIGVGSNGTCGGREGSAFCAYPWFSYSCTFHAFEFGATDYPETSTDFGKSAAYSTVSAQNAGQFGYYPPQRFSLPTCGGPADQLTVQTSGAVGGSVRFLQQTISSSTLVSDLTPGSYSVEADVPAGDSFVQWVATGGAVVADPASPWTSLELTTNGSLTAVFAATAATVHVLLASVGCPGRISIVAGTDYAPQLSVVILRSGSVDLAPGIYSMQAMPDPGCLFSGWNWTASAARVASGAAIYTWLEITGAQPVLGITADLAPTVQAAGLAIRLEGALGSLVVNGTAYSSDTTIPLAPGTYPISSLPLPGNPPAVLTSGIAADSIDVRTSGDFTLAPGLHSVTAIFHQSAAVQVAGSDPGGQFSIGGGALLDEGSTTIVDQTTATTYALLVVPPAGEQLVGWTSSPSSALWANAPGAPDTVLVNGSGILTAQFASAAAISLAVSIVPASAGWVTMDLGPTLWDGAMAPDLAPGTHLVQVVPAPGFSFSGWATSGSATVVPGGGAGAWPSGWDRLTVTAGSPPGLQANFATRSFPVTFVSSPAGATATVNASMISHGTTVRLGPGSHALSGVLSTGGAVGGWTASSGLTIRGTPGAFVLVVAGPGTLYATGTGLLDAYVNATPASGLAPLTVDFNAVALNGTPPYTFTWQFGDGSAGSGASVTHSFAQGGNFSVGIRVNDITTATAYRTILVGVVPNPLVAAIQANVSSGPAGVSVAFNGSASGGQGPYGFAWDFGDGIGSAVGSSVSYQFLHGGYYLVTLTAGDAAGTRATAATGVLIQPATNLSVILRADPANVTLGASVRISAEVSGGLPPYQFRWSSMPLACTSLDDANLSCSPASTGTYTITVQVYDHAGVGASGIVTLGVLARSGSASPVGWFGLPSPYDLVLLGTGAGIVLLAAVLIVHRSRRDRGDPPRPPSSDS